MSRSRVGRGAACALLTGVVAAALPAAASAASIVKSVALTGDPVVGATLTANVELAAPVPAVAPTLVYRWQRCDTDGTNCIDIPGATAATYDLTPADVGRHPTWRPA